MGIKRTARFLRKRKCVQCGTVGAWFRPFRKGATVFFSRKCHECVAAYSRAWRKNRTRTQKDIHDAYMKDYRPLYRKRFPEKIRGSKEWRELNPELSLWDSLMSRARGRSRQKKPFNVDMTCAEFLEEIGKLPKICPVLGIPMKIGVGGFSDNSVSIDKIDCSKPYRKGNIAAISYCANAIKRDGTAEEHRKIAQWMDRMARRNARH